jgi:hypothetical protein
MAAIFLSGFSAFAQKNAHEIDYVYPAGGTPGTTFTAIIGGQKLAGINDFTIYLDDQAVGLDSLIRLIDKDGKQLAFNDDFEDKGMGLETHHADSYFTTALPADGTFFIHITDAQSKGGSDFACRLRISEPRPDFALRVVPSSIEIRPGKSAQLLVYALRRDGFTNAITVSLKDAPKGFFLSGGRIPENEDKAQITLNALAESSEKPVNLVLEG